ncbi:uncharacterized protein LOC143962561 [Lithobates pipiens]
MCNLLKILSLLCLISDCSMAFPNLEIEKIIEDLETLKDKKDKLNCSGQLVHSLNENRNCSIEKMSCRASHTFSKMKLCNGYQNIRDILDTLITSLDSVAKSPICETSKTTYNAERAIEDLLYYFQKLKLHH